MKTTNARRGKVSEYQFFFIFLVSRAVVALTFYQSILNNGLTPDSIISILLAAVFNILLSLPAYYCVIKHKNPLSSRWASILYILYFIYFAAVNISRFAFFASSRTTEGSNAFLFIFIMAVASCYAASLGIEALGRFSVICSIISILVLIMIMLLNVKSFDFTNFFPFFINERKGVFENSLVFTSNSIEPALLLSLSGTANSKKAKPFFLSILAAYFAIFLMIIFCIGVLGSSTPLFSYPIFTLFQMTSFKAYSRLDMIYTAFGFFAVFAKCSVIVYCAAKTIKKFEFSKKCAALFVFICAVSTLITKLFFNGIYNNAKTIYISLSVIFCLVIPVLFLIFSKKDKGDEVIENF